MRWASGSVLSMHSYYLIHAHTKRTHTQTLAGEEGAAQDGPGRCESAHTRKAKENCILQAPGFDSL